MPDYENYLHRIGRAGRFGRKGIAVTLYDDEVNERCFNEILEYYSI